jgi:hypothetical protein
VVVVVEEPAVEVLIAERRLEGVEVHPDQYALHRDATHPNGIVCGEWSGIRLFEKAFDAKSAKEREGSPRRLQRRCWLGGYGEKGKAAGRMSPAAAFKTFLLFLW